jgi:hypothetical protein
MPEVIAAKNNNIKNNSPIKEEQGNCVNISGNEMNTNVGPAVGVTPNENTIGNIIMPAVIAIKVSKKISVYADFNTFVSSFT